MGSRITVLREARGLSMIGLAEKLGISRAVVWKWESGDVTNIRPENFIRLCHILGVTPEYLLWGPERAPARDDSNPNVPQVPKRG